MFPSVSLPGDLPADDFQCLVKNRILSCLETLNCRKHPDIRGKSFVVDILPVLGHAPACADPEKAAAFKPLTQGLAAGARGMVSDEHRVGLHLHHIDEILVVYGSLEIEIEHELELCVRNRS